MSSSLSVSLDPSAIVTARGDDTGVDLFDPTDSGDDGSDCWSDLRADRGDCREIFDFAVTHVTHRMGTTEEGRGARQSSAQQ